MRNLGPGDGQVFSSLTEGVPGLKYRRSQDFLTESGAIVSADERYRYVLWRIWTLDRVGARHPGPQLCVFVMLNPSTADHRDDDATIKRCRALASRWGHRGLAVVNLFGMKATHPTELTRNSDPEGPFNQRCVEGVLADPRVSRVVLAWGEGGSLNQRSESFLVAHGDRELYCIDDPMKRAVLTRHGDPRHPVRLSLKSRPRRLNVAAGKLTLELGTKGDGE